MDEKTRVDFNRIEELVVQRHRRVACDAIPAFLRNHAKRDRSLIFQACDWYRRLGLFSAAYRLLELGEDWVHTGSADEFQRQRMIWAVRLLSAMGAAELAQGMLGVVKPRTVEEHRIIGEIWLANFEYENAIKHFERMKALDPRPASYHSRLANLNFADALNGAGHVEQALALAADTYQASSEPLLQAISLQAQGEFLARMREWDRASRLLEESAKLFPAEDESPDYAVMLKWKGYVDAQRGKRKKGMVQMNRAIEILKKVGTSPETLLDIYRLQVDAGLVPTLTLGRMSLYPGLSPVFRRSLQEGSEGTHAHPEQKKVQSAEVQIDFSRDELTLRGVCSLGVPLEYRALAYLRRAEHWGIPIVKLKSLFWSGEVHAFLQMESRIQQLFRRLRHTHGFCVEVKGNIAALSPKDLKRVSVIGLAGEERPPSFLESRSCFKRSELEVYYSLSRSHSCNWLNRWESAGWIMRTGAGRSSKYLVR